MGKTQVVVDPPKKDCFLNNTPPKHGSGNLPKSTKNAGSRGFPSSQRVPSTTKPLPPCPAKEKQVTEPEVPPSLTAGLPDPGSIERQKNAYARGLEEQLRRAKRVRVGERVVE